MKRSMLAATVSLIVPTVTVAQMVEVFPHVQADIDAGSVEFTGRVPIVLTDADAPDVYLEVIVCTPDTKEHEALVVTPALPSHVHAALLMVGLEPGEPGSWTFVGEGLEGEWIAHDPTGDPVRVELIYTDKEGVERSVTPSAWVRHLETHEALPNEPFTFTGSKMIDRGFGGERYDADGTGVLIGLATFGSETIAWPHTFSPDSGTDEPVWVANPMTTPPVDTPVRVRLTRIGRK